MFRHLGFFQVFLPGIFVGFLGSVFDNFYWGIAWTTEYLHIEARDTLFKLGSWPNIIFRQLAGIAAAYCHMKAFYEGHKTHKGRGVGGKKLLSMTLLAGALGALYVPILYWLRSSLPAS